MENPTTIQISKETSKRLKEFKTIPREPYDFVLNRLMDSKEELNKKRKREEKI